MRLLARLWANMARRKGPAEAAAVEPAAPGSSSPLARSLGEVQALAERGETAAAVELCGRLAAAYPGHAEPLAYLGNLSLLAGRAGEACSLYRRALQLNPGHVPAFINLVRLELERGDAEAAGRCWQEFPPRAGDLAAAGEAELRALFELASVLKNRQGVVEICEATLQRSPGLVWASRRLADAYGAEGRIDAALDVLSVALAHHPDDVKLWTQTGMLAQSVRQLDLAEQAFVRVRELAPDLVVGRIGLGVVRFEQGRMDQARALFAAVLDEHPGNALALCNLANLAREEGDVDEAEKLVAQVAGDGTETALVLLTRAVLAQDRNRFDEAEALYDRVLAMEPGHFMALRHRAQLLLLREDYGRAWEAYASRFVSGSIAAREIPLPEADCPPGPGEAILVYAEQGIGDEIMFASCLPDLCATGARVVLECHPRLGALFARSFPDVQVIPHGQDDRSDFWAAARTPLSRKIAIGSLPGWFRRSIGSFPGEGGYLKADPARVAQWRTRLQALAGAGPVIGVSWKGGMARTREALRTIPPVTLFESLPAGAHFVCLQYKPAREDLAAIRAAGFGLAEFPEVVGGDADDYAALLSALDLVVTACNTNVHLAGALGLPARCLAPAAAEWRYGRFSDRMRWYPSVRMLRQARTGDWRDALDRLRRDIAMEFPDLA